MVREKGGSEEPPDPPLVTGLILDRHNIIYIFDMKCSKNPQLDRAVEGDPQSRRSGKSVCVAKGVFGYKFVAANHRMCVVLCC